MNGIRSTHPAAEGALRHVTARSTGGPLAPGLRLTINFHPDRVAGDRPLLARMAEDGVYRSQFVTGTSNGGLTARPGGDRWRWESRIFGGAYDAAPAAERPVYAALDHRRNPGGAAPRFGSSYFRLAAGTLRRATFCYPDSSTGPEHFGVADRCALVERAVADAARGVDGVDALDVHVEAQVHGPVRFDRDVEALVLDPGFRGTAVEELAARLPCPVEWHAGFRLEVAELRRHPGYRGPEFVALGERIARDGRLDPRIIGEAVRGGRYDPQDLKKVWHLLARFGPPAASPASDQPPSISRAFTPICHR